METGQAESRTAETISSQGRIRHLKTAQTTRQNMNQTETVQTAVRRQARPSRYTDTAPKNVGKVAAPRRREQENDLKMQSLKSILIVLVVILIAALIYEVVLGHGTRMTGSERMAEQEKAKQEMLLETESEAAETDGENAGKAAGGAADEENAGKAADGAADEENAGKAAEGAADGESAGESTEGTSGGEAVTE